MSASFIFELTFLILSLVWFSIFGWIIFSFISGLALPFLFKGAPYVQSNKKAIAIMLEVANLQAGQKAVDLGAGSGAIVIALARQGIQTDGYEINPLLVQKGSRAIKKLQLQEVARIHCQNLWKADMAHFDAIFIYGIPFMLPKLEEKIHQEAKAGVKIVCNGFALPTWQPIKKEGSIYLYQKP